MLRPCPKPGYLAAVSMAMMLTVGGCGTGDAVVADPVEHVVRPVDAACFRERLRSYTRARGFVVRSSDDRRLVAARSARAVGSSLFATTPMEIPEERILLTFTPVAGGGMRVGMQGGFTTISGTGFEGVTPVALRRDDVASFTSELDRMAAACPAAG